MLTEVEQLFVNEWRAARTILKYIRRLLVRLQMLTWTNTSQFRGSYQQLWPKFKAIDFNETPNAFQWYYAAQERLELARERFMQALEMRKYNTYEYGGDSPGYNDLI